MKFVFSKKATKFCKVFTVDLILCSKCQIDSEDFVSFCGLLYELYEEIVFGLMIIILWKKYVERLEIKEYVTG